MHVDAVMSFIQDAGSTPATSTSRRCCVRRGVAKSV